jgi:t-SNARE complex subunit (syntaxin)
MAALVAEQSEMINSIENNINDTKEYTQQAVKELKKANKLAKRSTRVRFFFVLVEIVLECWLMA